MAKLQREAQDWNDLYKVRGFLWYYYLAQKHKDVCNRTHYLQKPELVLYIQKEAENKLKFMESELLIDMMSYNILLKSINNKRYRFIFMMLSITSECPEIINRSGHANAILIDKENKTIERWEPYGFISESPRYSKYIHDEITKHLTDKFIDGVYITKYIDNSYLTEKGFQHLQCLEKEIPDDIGFCEAWSVWYLDQRLSYPDIPVKDLLEKMKKEILSNKSLSKFIAGYSKYITQFLDKNNFPVKFNEKVIHLNKHLKKLLIVDM